MRAARFRPRGREPADRAVRGGRRARHHADALGTGLQGAPSALTLVPDEEQSRARVADQVAQVGDDPPPVSIPFEATIMYGRGARAIAFESSTSLVTIWLG